MPTGESTMAMARQAVRRASAIDTLLLGERKVTRQNDTKDRGPDDLELPFLTQSRISTLNTDGAWRGVSTRPRTPNESGRPSLPLPITL